MGRSENHGGPYCTAWMKQIMMNKALLTCTASFPLSNRGQTKVSGHQCESGNRMEAFVIGSIALLVQRIRGCGYVDRTHGELRSCRFHKHCGPGLLILSDGQHNF